jgi:hypothetical protein
MAGRNVTFLASHALGFDDYRMAAIKRAMRVSAVPGAAVAPAVCELTNGDVLTLPAAVAWAPNCLFDAANPGAVHTAVVECLMGVDPEMRGAWGVRGDGVGRA